MTTVTREHLAGLKLAKQELGAFNVAAKAAADYFLDPLIAQASAAPEQESVGWQQRYICPQEGPSPWQACDERSAEILKGRSDYELRPVYTRPDADLERLRAELELWKLRSGGNLYAAQVMEELAEEQEDDLAALQQKLAWAQAMLNNIASRGLSPLLTEAEVEKIDAFLSAAAQPAEVKL